MGLPFRQKRQHGFRVISIESYGFDARGIFNVKLLQEGIPSYRLGVDDFRR